MFYEKHCLNSSPCAAVTMLANKRIDFRSVGNGAPMGIAQHAGIFASHHKTSIVKHVIV